MGVDAIITARGDLTIDQNSPWFDGDIKTDDGIAYFDTNERYYGQGYARGEWPVIYAQIRKLGSVFPRATIHYGSDHDVHDDPGEICTNEYLETIWQYYLQHGHSEYDNPR